MSDRRTKVHYVTVRVGQAYDPVFFRLIQEHAIVIDPAIGAAESRRAGLDFAKFLLACADPEYIYALAQELYLSGYEFGG